MRRITLFCTLILTLVLLAGCGQKASSRGSNKAQAVTNDNIESVLADPDSYVGAKADLRARVLSSPGSEDDRVWRAQIKAEPSGTSDARLYVRFKADRLDIGANEFVHVQGTIEQDPRKLEITDENLRYPFVEATHFERVAAHDILAPTLHVLEPKISDSQFGVTVTLEKIEFAAEETRAYIRIDNDTDLTSRVSELQLKITQGQREFIFEPNLATDYERLPQEVPGGAFGSGVLGFEPIDYDHGSLTVIIGAGTDDYTQAFELFELPVAWATSAPGDNQ